MVTNGDASGQLKLPVSTICIVRSCRIPPHTHLPSPLCPDMISPQTDILNPLPLTKEVRSTYTDLTFATRHEKLSFIS